MAAPYDDEQKATVIALLDQTGGNVALTSHLTGVSYRTVARWAVGEGVSAAVAELAADKKAERCDIWASIELRALEALHKRLDDMSGRDLAWVAGVSCDKRLLLGGQPTEIHEDRHSISVDLATRLARLSPAERDRYEQLLAEQDLLLNGAEQHNRTLAIIRGQPLADVPIDDSALSIDSAKDDQANDKQ